MKYWHISILQRNITTGDKQDVAAADDSNRDAKSSDGEPTRSPSNLVFGYLNLFSDGVVCFSSYLQSSLYFKQNMIHDKPYHLIERFVATAAQFYGWDGFRKCFSASWICRWVV